jgi:hypothetical protein
MRTGVLAPPKHKRTLLTGSQDAHNNRIQIEEQLLGHAVKQFDVQIGGKCAYTVSCSYAESVSASFFVWIHADVRPIDVSEGWEACTGRVRQGNYGICWRRSDRDSQGETLGGIQRELKIKRSLFWRQQCCRNCGHYERISPCFGSVCVN